MQLVTKDGKVRIPLKADGVRAILTCYTLTQYKAEHGRIESHQEYHSVIVPEGTGSPVGENFWCHVCKHFARCWESRQRQAFNIAGAKLA